MITKHGRQIQVAYMFSVTLSTSRSKHITSFIRDKEAC